MATHIREFSVLQVVLVVEPVFPKISRAASCSCCFSAAAAAAAAAAATTTPIANANKVINNASANTAKVQAGVNKKNAIATALDVNAIAAANVFAAADSIAAATLLCGAAAVAC